MNDCFKNITKNMRRLSLVHGLLSSSFSPHGCKMFVAPPHIMSAFKARRLVRRGKPCKMNLSLLSNQANTFQEASLDDFFFALISHMAIPVRKEAGKLENKIAVIDLNQL